MSTPPTKKQRLSTNVADQDSISDDKILREIQKFKCDLIKELEQYISTKAIIDNILLYSNHTQIHNLWLNMHNKLGKYSFIMRPGCKVSQIQKFEKDHNLTLPDDLRISYLICDAVMFPIIFYDEVWDDEQRKPKLSAFPKTPRPLNHAPECIMQALVEWKSHKGDTGFYEYFLNEEEDAKDCWQNEEYYDKFISVFLGCDNNQYDQKKFDKVFEIGRSNTRSDIGGVQLFWNSGNNKIFCGYEYGELSATIAYETIYDSFEDYLMQWSKFDYYTKFTKEWLQLYTDDDYGYIAIPADNKMSQQDVEDELKSIDGRDYK